MRRLDSWVRIALVCAAGGTGVANALSYSPLDGVVTGVIVGILANLTSLLLKQWLSR